MSVLPELDGEMKLLVGSVKICPVAASQSACRGDDFSGLVVQLVVDTRLLASRLARPCLGVPRLPLGQLAGPFECWVMLLWLSICFCRLVEMAHNHRFGVGWVAPHLSGCELRPCGHASGVDGIAPR